MIDGHGQLYDAGAYRYLPRFLHGKDISYVAGEASNSLKATDLMRADFGLKKFRRHYILLRPSFVIIYDELEADHDAEWSWLIHHYEGMEVDRANHSVVGTNKFARAQIKLFSSSPLNYQLTDKFLIESKNFRDLTDKDGNMIEYKNYWHFTGVSKQKNKKMRYLAIIQVVPGGNFIEIQHDAKAELFFFSNWKLEVSLNISQDARIALQKKG